MKKIFKYLAAFAASAAAIGCYPDVVTPDAGMLPDANEFEVQIDVDQETNYVTFTMLTPGVVPMWIFGDQKVDRTENTRYAYTQNGIKLRFRDEGTHTVEVKAYNAHGVSMGSVMKTFEMENTFRDPFDPSPYVRKLSKEWIWNSNVAGHFGCGPDTSDPSSWWSCGANEKADWSLYNDTMTFTEDGKYLFNPGPDGKVYVNAGFTALGTSPDGNDFLVDIPAYESTYTIENNWNDSGIEEIWLVLPKGKNLSYIPNQSIYDNPRFLITELSSKEVKLSAANAPNGDGTISWLYNFVPAGQTVTVEELLAGKGSEGKVWVMDSEAQGHLGCGESAENSAGWWAAPANDKAESGMYDDEITFYPDGKYVYNPGPDGLLYVNWGVTAIGPNTGAEPDNSVAWETVTSSYKFDGETITLAENTPMIYVPSDAMYKTPTLKVKELTANTLQVVFMNEGCYWQMILKAKNAVDEPEPTPDPLDPASEANLWKSAAVNVSFWFANDGWGQIADPAWTAGDNEYKLTVPEGIGSSQWQGQVVFNHTGITLDPAKKYDFQVTFLSSEDHPHVTIKPCYQHPTELDGNGNPQDVNPLIEESSVKLLSDEEYVYTKVGLQGTDIPDLKLVFDFGGAVAGSEIVIKGITIQEHQD